MKATRMNDLLPRILLAGFLVQACTVPPSAEQVPSDLEVTPDPGFDDFRRLRREARGRRRRIIFNNDGDDNLFFPVGTPVTAENLLARRTVPLVGTQVDTIFYCTTQSFGAYSHRTRVAEQHVASLPRKGRRNATQELARQGTDSLAIMVDYCREKGIEIFATVRMNDVHDATGDFAALGSEFKRKNPQYLFGTKEKPPPFGYWSGVDFGHAQVRDHAFRILEELIQNYDIDGLELDFWRHPPFFRTQAWGQIATQEELENMTQLLRRIHQVAEARGRLRGRPVLLAARVLESVELSRDLGLDLLTWLREGLLDLLIVGEVALTPWEEMIQLGQRYGVPVYPCVRRSMVEGQRGSAESLRALALTAWKKGADGIYFFNIFPEEAYPEVYTELGDPAVLERLDKIYSLDPVGRNSFGRYFPEFWKHKSRKLFTSTSPVELQPGTRYQIPMYLADRALEAKAAGAPRTRMRLQAEGSEEEGALELSLNGHPLGLGEKQGEEIHYPVPHGWLKTGYNLLQVFTQQPSIRLRDILLEVQY